MYYVLEHMAPGSLYGQRITIGTEATIASVQEADFRDYYGKWYAASNATLLVVADADPAVVVAALKEQFAAAPQKTRPTPQDPGVRKYERSLAIVASDPEVQTEQVRICRIEPARPPTTTVAQYRDDLVARIGQFAFNRRLEAAVEAGDTSYMNGRVSLSNQPNLLYTAELDGQANPGQWRAALQELALELQRARTFGFTARELEDARKQILASATRAVETEPTRLAGALIGRINAAITAGEPVMAAEQELELTTRLLRDITTEEVSRRFAAELDPQAVAFIAVLPAAADVPSEAQLLELGTQALAATPTPLAETTRPTQLLAALPAPGKIAEGAEHAASGVWSGWLSNNVRLHHRFMDTQKTRSDL